MAAKLPRVETVLEVLLRLTEAALPDSVPATPSNWLWVRLPVVIFSVTSPPLLSPTVSTELWVNLPIDSAWLSVNWIVPVPVLPPAVAAPAKMLTLLPVLVRV